MITKYFLWILPSLIILVSHSRVVASNVTRIVDYTRHRVIRVVPLRESHIELLNTLSVRDTLEKDISLWNDVRSVGQILDIQISDNFYQNFTSLLNTTNLPYTVLIEDLQKLIDNQKKESEDYRRWKRRNERTLRSRRSIRRRSQRRSQEITDKMKRLISDFHVAEDFGFRELRADKISEDDISSIIDNYASYDEIVDWLQVVKQFRPELVGLEVLTKSTEKLSLYLIRIGKARSDGEVKPAIWIDAGIHAREWIAPATAIYFIYSLVTGYGKKDSVTKLVDKFDWFILPILNPDGYEYSRTADRMWRKTRSRITNSKDCRGVDGNRNFDYQWRGDCKPGASCRGKNPCDDVYSGPQPFSEPETRGLATWIMANRNRIKLYIALHSYSQLWLVPWGYTLVHPIDYPELASAARKAVDELQSHYNTHYRIGVPGEVLYIAAGGSYDWVKAVAGVKYVYTIELRDTGTYGFLLPRSQILPVGIETWAGVLTLAEEIQKDSCWMERNKCW